MRIHLVAHNSQKFHHSSSWSPLPSSVQVQISRELRHHRLILYRRLHADRCDRHFDALCHIRRKNGLQLLDQFSLHPCPFLEALGCDPAQ